MTHKYTNTSKNSTSPPYIARLTFTNTITYRSHLCGYDINLTYPQTGGHFPTLNPPFQGGDGDASNTRSSLRRKHKGMLFKQKLKQDVEDRKRGVVRRSAPGEEEARFAKREQWKRDLSGRPNGTLDPMYQCDLYGEMIDYALNFSLPWSGLLFSFVPLCV